ncbi:hypothetical protein SteCoe_34602 [Stentor coeruleus]|uniref:Uncharacterized protein n=1 Tax=Stentor coeruleus TaxID=5963 RepID=A0A1R2AU74_9CILI|nr:hypothetical protein SteCoe_34602 [Stentor coeruleus]
MLKCSFCHGRPLMQCTECENKLYCKSCSQDHISFHEANSSKCNFEAIKKIFSEEKMSKLKKCIQEYIIIINIQKDNIIKEALKLKETIESMTKISLEQLDLMIEEYEAFSKLEAFGIQDIMLAEDFLKRQLVFEYPSFTKVEGILIKNSKIIKTYGEPPNESLLSSKYNLYIQSHTDTISSLAISNNNQFLVSGSSDKTVRLWNILEKKQIFIYKGHTGIVTSVAISNNNEFIISGSIDTTLRVWNFYEKKSKAILKGHSSEVLCITITNDNKTLISGSLDMTIKIWNLTTKILILTLSGHFNRVNSLSLSKDNQTLVSGFKDSSILVWSLSKRSRLATINGHYQSVNSVVISNNNEFIVSGSDDKTIRIWNLHTYKQKAVLTGHEYYVCTVSITNNDKYAVSGSEDYSIRVWNLIEKTQEVILRNCSSIIKSIAITNGDKFFVFASEDKIVTMFDFYDKLQEVAIQNYVGKISSVAKTRNNKFIVTGNKDNIIRVWRLCKENNQFDTKNCLYKKENNDVIEKNGLIKILGFEGSTMRKWELGEDNQGKYCNNQCGVDWRMAVTGENCFLVVGFYRGIIKLCEFFKRKDSRAFQGHIDTITSVAMLEDNKYAASSSKDCTVRLWDLIEKNEDAVLKGHLGAVWKVVVSSDNKYLISGSEDKTVRLWNVNEKKLETVLEGHTCPVKSLLIQNENQFASVSETELLIWDIQQRKYITKLPVYMVYAFNENDMLCVTLSNKLNALLFWDLKEKYKYKLLKKCNLIKEDLTLSKKNCFLTQQTFGLVSNNHILLWNLLDDKQISILKGHTKNIISIAVSKDYSLLVTGSEDMTTKVWYIQKKQLIATFIDHSNYISCVAITNDNNFVISGSYDMSIRIWNLSTKEIEFILKGHNNAVIFLALSNDSKYLASFSWDKTLRVWNLDNKKEIKIIVFQSDKICVAFSKNSKFLVTTTNKSLINVIYFDKSSQDSHIQSIKSGIDFIELTYNNKFVVIGYDDCTIACYNLIKKKLEISITLQDNKIPKIAVSENLNKVYIATGFGISVLSIDKKFLKHKMFFNQSVEQYFNDEFEDKITLMPEISKLG